MYDFLDRIWPWLMRILKWYILITFSLIVLSLGWFCFCFVCGDPTAGWMGRSVSGFFEETSGQVGVVSVLLTLSLGFAKSIVSFVKGLPAESLYLEVGELVSLTPTSVAEIIALAFYGCTANRIVKMLSNFIATDMGKEEGKLVKFVKMWANALFTLALLVIFEILSDFFAARNAQIGYFVVMAAIFFTLSLVVLAFDSENPIKAFFVDVFTSIFNFLCLSVSLFFVRIMFFISENSLANGGYNFSAVIIVLVAIAGMYFSLRFISEKNILYSVIKTKKQKEAISGKKIMWGCLTFISVVIITFILNYNI